MAAARGGYVPVLHAATSDRADEVDTLLAAEAVLGALRGRGYRTGVVNLGLDLGVIDSLALERPLAVFNLTDAVLGDGRLAPLVPARLDALGLAYTGCGTSAWLDTLSKIGTKLKLVHAGLPTPAWSEDGRGFPSDVQVIVKSVWEHGSLGLDETSVMRSAHAKQAIAERNLRWRTEHFAECFIEGREFNLSLLQGLRAVELLPIAEIAFSKSSRGTPLIVGYDAKWAPHSAAYTGTPRRFGLEAAEPALASELSRLAHACWTLFGPRGYARVDFRVDPEGRPFILEVNMNPCLTPDAGFAAAAAAAGLAYGDMIELIVEASLGALQATA